MSNPDEIREIASKIIDILTTGNIEAIVFISQDSENGCINQFTYGAASTTIGLCTLVSDDLRNQALKPKDEDDE